jgi:hypothetical protein
VPAGLAVTPARWTRWVSNSMKNSTYNRRDVLGGLIHEYERAA